MARGPGKGAGGAPAGPAVPRAGTPQAPGIVGTAGHVDHGKTTLVRALTGVDTDRLPEERQRGISIDLGFAELTLPSGRQAAIVDVPGHERFIRNMVAGASGIDLCLLVVAADEGVMPQTREHLDIALLLGVSRGVVALTKADVVEAAWLELAAEDVRALLRGTALADAPLLPVSAVSGQGLDELRRALDVGLAGVEAHQDRGFARLPVDRVFSVSGFGTVATGTLTSGHLALEDRVELLPAGEALRVRGLQVHGRPVAYARAGQRVAVNLGGGQRQGVARGDVLATPGSLHPQTLLAVRLHALGQPLRHGQRLHLHLGTAEALCRLTLLEGDALEAHADTRALLRLERPVAAARGDRFIVRSYSPMATVAGGVVLDAGRRYRRHREEDLQALALAERGDPADLLLATLRGPQPVGAAEAARRTGLPREEATAALGALRAEGRVRVVGDAPLYLAAGAWHDLRARAQGALADYHRQHPLRVGMPREELRHAVLPGLDARSMAAVVTEWTAERAVRVDGERVARPDFTPELPAGLAAVADRLVTALEAAGLTPPPIGEALAAAGFAADMDQAEEGPAEFLAHLVEAGRLVRVAAGLYFGAGAVAGAAERVRALLRQRGQATVAELRDVLGVTRKHAVPLAEYLDGIHVTRRVGDIRQLV